MIILQTIAAKKINMFLPDDFDSVSADQRLMLLESNERNESLLRELERRRGPAGITSRIWDITTIAVICIN